MSRILSLAALLALFLPALATRADEKAPAAAPPAVLTVVDPAAALPKAVNVELPKADAEGWIALFDGKSLAGWYGDPKIWRLKDGCISGKAERILTNTFLIYNHPFANFVLEADCMLIKGKGFTNSGIQYRSEVTNPERWAVRGYQADMGEGWWGANYQEGLRGVLWSPAPEAAKTVRLFEAWNHYTITCDGTRIKHELNGVLSGELDDKNEKKRSLSGIVALQYHAPGADFEVRFKDIRIKILPETETK